MAHVSLPAHLSCGEFSFIRKTNALDEDAGYLVTFVTDSEDNFSTELYIYDAHALTDASAPICRIRCPQRVPSGFHGNFVRKMNQLSKL